MIIPILFFKIYLTLFNSIIYGFSTVLGLILFTFAVSNVDEDDYLLKEGMPIQEVSKIESSD